MGNISCSSFIVMVFSKSGSMNHGWHSAQITSSKEFNKIARKEESEG